MYYEIVKRENPSIVLIFSYIVIIRLTTFNLLLLVCYSV